MNRAYFEQNVDVEIDVYDEKSGKSFGTVTCKYDDIDNHVGDFQNYEFIGYADKQSDEDVQYIIDKAKQFSPSKELFKSTVYALLKDY